MQICYDAATGAVLFTVQGNEVPPGIGGNWVAAEAQELGDLTAWRVIEGALSLVDIAPARLAAVANVNAICGQIRAQFLTNIPFQDGIYAKKKAEAQKYLADSSLAGLFYLPLEIGITAPTAYELAQVWVNMDNALDQLSALIEAARVGANAQLSAAETPEQIAAITGGYADNLRALGLSF